MKDRRRFGRKRRDPNDTDHPAFARYRAILPKLEALEKEAQEVRRRAHARRKLIS